MILKADKISKNYGKKIILHDIDADINVNEISGLLGPNGAGKTTLFYILAGLLQPSEGEIIFDKSIITRKTISERANLGIVYLPQEPSIFRNLSVLENIKSAFEIQKINKVDIDLKTEEVLNDFDIESIAMQKGNQLSGGQRRRVEIARSISLNPKFIMLDEPFAGIDPIAIHEIKELIKKLSDKGLGILISDHNVKATMDICNEIFIINEGCIISKGTPEEVSKNKIVKKTYLGE
ncbi:LPS export ABC transporter ATP-binding protein [SAR86 cluster bacterium]|jgi:lipopolysaccharide export system ATP-binding protein|nr:LPS export ABC transporter ATP-binding protein [SAR86 cluster bacterium]